ncbi:uncharacterized protein [Drosophila tropicalis]|uniref:uncharacterized protein n=1 Tax=Drosophila tropicalis TaxID=46794 RepID=UPI0035ABD916
MSISLLYVCTLTYVSLYAEAATVVYHQPVVVHHSPLDLATEVEEHTSHEPHEEHPGYTIVAPLTKIAHVTYDSVPISHTPFEHVPLFQRIGHVKTIRF